MKNESWPLMGYAPGGYTIVCVQCKKPVYECDKRASHCLNCAAAAANDRLRELSRVRPEISFQRRCLNWALACFGLEVASNKVERNHRFLEEALELVQATGCTKNEAIKLVDYVYSRPVGEPEQEVGGVMNTLACLCNAQSINMEDAARIEMERVEAPEIMAKIRAKQAAKPKFSPLPQ